MMTELKGEIKAEGIREIFRYQMRTTLIMLKQRPKYFLRFHCRGSSSDDKQVAGGDMTIFTKFRSKLKLSKPQSNILRHISY